MILEHFTVDGKAFTVDGKALTLQKAWTPADVPTICWYDASDASANIVSSGGAVSQWTDKSGNGNHLVQIDGASQPSTGLTQINGRNVIDGDGTEFLERDSITLPADGDCATFGVFRIDSVDSDADSIMSIDAAVDWQFDANNATQFDGRIRFTGNTNANLTGGPYTGTHIFGLKFDFTGAGEYYSFIDGIQKSDVAYDAKLSESQILRIFSNRGGSDQINAGCGEVIILGDCSDECRQKIEGYLAHKWGLEANLDVSHPYKSAPPTV